MSVSALGRLKNHNVPHLHPNFTMFMPLNRLQLKICPEMKFIAILRFKLRFFIRNTGVDSVFTQKF